MPANCSYSEGPKARLCYFPSFSGSARYSHGRSQRDHVWGGVRTGTQTHATVKYRCAGVDGIQCDGIPSHGTPYHVLQQTACITLAPFYVLFHTEYGEEKSRGPVYFLGFVIARGFFKTGGLPRAGLGMQGGIAYIVCPKPSGKSSRA